MRIAVAVLGLLVCGSVVSAQSAKARTLPVHIMNDGFAYQIADFGVGKVKEDGRLPQIAFWIKLRITNLSERQLSVPQYPSDLRLRGTDAIDDAKNVYSARRMTVQGVTASSGRYKPHESSIELWVISASEMVDGIKSLKVVLGDTNGLGRSAKFFEFTNPQARVKDFDPIVDDPDPLSLAVEARSAFFPPIPER